MTSARGFSRDRGDLLHGIVFSEKNGYAPVPRAVSKNGWIPRPGDVGVRVFFCIEKQPPEHTKERNDPAMFVGIDDVCGADPGIVMFPLSENQGTVLPVVM